LSERLNKFIIKAIIMATVTLKVYFLLAIIFTLMKSMKPKNQIEFT